MKVYCYSLPLFSIVLLEFERQTKFSIGEYNNFGRSYIFRFKIDFTDEM